MPVQAVLHIGADGGLRTKCGTHRNSGRKAGLIHLAVILAVEAVMLEKLITKLEKEMHA